MFEAEAYFAVVHEAMDDRSWETRPRAVVRHMRVLRPYMTSWAVRHGEGVTVHHRVDDMLWSTDLLVPPGSPADLAGALAGLLDSGIDPRQIVADRLWR